MHSAITAFNKRTLGTTLCRCSLLFHMKWLKSFSKHCRQCLQVPEEVITTGMSSSKALYDGQCSDSRGRTGYCVGYGVGVDINRSVDQLSVKEKLLTALLASAIHQMWISFFELNL